MSALTKKSRRGRKKKVKLKLSPSSLTSILSTILMATACVILISYFAPNQSVNERIQEVIRGTFGGSAILLPFILGIWGLLYIRTIELKYVDIRVLFGLTGLMVSLAGLLHIFYDPSKALTIARAGEGGGILGYQLSLLLRNTVSTYGGFVLLLASAIISVLITLDIGLDDVFLNIANVISRALHGKDAVASKFKRAEDTGVSSDELSNTPALDEITISSGADMLSHKVSQGSLFEPANALVEDIEVETTFEVIPAPSEPMGEGKGVIAPIAPAVASSSKKLPEVAMPLGGLPYADRVWTPPPLDLLNDPPKTKVDRGDVMARAKIIESTLASFGIAVKVRDINYGPTVTRYALETEQGVKIAKISNLQYDLALALASPSGSVRIEAPIPGKSLVGIEVPNNTRVVVAFKEVLTSDSMKGLKSPLGIVLGKDVGGNAVVYDIHKMPHLLVAGATGSGKSVFLHNIMFSLLYRCSPNECKFIMIDPKRVELINYQDIPHLYAPVVTDIEKAPSVFKWAVAEMDRRYKLFESAKARNIQSYNEKSGFQAMPYIVIIVDELAEIMVADPAAVEKSIIRLAQLARATGIHLVLTTQRPSTDVVTGLIKANIPCRVAFNVTSNTDSRVIIDQVGAEKLLGKGDMLFVPPDASKPVRVQGAMIDDVEINRVVAHLKGSGVQPDYKEEILTAHVADELADKSISAGGEGTDDLFDEAVEIVVSSKKASASLLQRRLSIGYARAARIIDELEASGIVGPARGSKPRDILQSSVSSATSDSMGVSSDFSSAHNNDTFTPPQFN
ncbi:MAG: DNA translocase FtsK 4TM domain-containing protein [Patescibacteria group bacterium]